MAINFDKSSWATLERDFNFHIQSADPDVACEAANALDNLLFFDEAATWSAVPPTGSGGTALQVAASSKNRVHWRFEFGMFKPWSQAFNTAEPASNLGGDCWKRWKNGEAFVVHRLNSKTQGVLTVKR